MPDPNPNEKPEIELSDEQKTHLSDQTPEDAIEDSFTEVDEEEFSLEHLSAAYAQVLKNRTVENQFGSNEVSDPDAVVEVDSGAEQVRSAEQVPVLIEPPSDDLVELEVDDDAACPISPATILEAILFVGGPKDVNLTSRKIAAVMRDVSPKEITALAKALNKSYENENRAYRVITEKRNLQIGAASGHDPTPKSHPRKGPRYKADTTGDRCFGDRGLQPTRHARAGRSNPFQIQRQYSKPDDKTEFAATRMERVVTLSKTLSYDGSIPRPVWT